MCLKFFFFFFFLAPLPWNYIGTWFVTLHWHYHPKLPIHQSNKQNFIILNNIHNIECGVVLHFVVSLRFPASFLQFGLYTETCKPIVALGKYTFTTCFHNSSNKSNCSMSHVVHSPFLRSGTFIYTYNNFLIYKREIQRVLKSNYTSMTKHFH